MDVVVAILIGWAISTAIIAILMLTVKPHTCTVHSLTPVDGNLDVMKAHCNRGHEMGVLTIRNGPLFPTPSARLHELHGYLNSPAVIPSGETFVRLPYGSGYNG